jgi:hypothetical protein
MMSIVLDELQKQLLAPKGELDSREGTIIAWEDGLVTYKRALGIACMERDVGSA